MHKKRTGVAKFNTRVLQFGAVLCRALQDKKFAWSLSRGTCANKAWQANGLRFSKVLGRRFFSALGILLASSDKRRSLVASPKHPTRRKPNSSCPTLPLKARGWPIASLGLTPCRHFFLGPDFPSLAAWCTTFLHAHTTRLTLDRTIRSTNWPRASQLLPVSPEPLLGVLTWGPDPVPPPAF